LVGVVLKFKDKILFLIILKGKYSLFLKISIVKRIISCGKT